MLHITSDNALVVLVDWQVRLAAVMDSTVEGRNRRRAAALLRGAQAAGVPLLATEQYPQGLGPTVPELAEALGESVEPFGKRDFSCMAVPEFVEALESTGRSHIVLAGMEAHICVYQTARALMEEGYVVHIPLDAIVSRHRTDFEAACSLYDRLGLVVTSVEAVMFDWVGRAEGDLFKTVSRLIR